MWQGVKESNPRKWFWRPLYYRYTNPPPYVVEFFKLCGAGRPLLVRQSFSVGGYCHDTTPPSKRIKNLEL